MKELKTNSEPREVFKKLNGFFQRIFLVNKHLGETFPLSAIVLPIVNEELNNLQTFWECFIEESYTNPKMREYLHIFILMDSLNVQKTSEKLTNIFQARYRRIKQVFSNMEDFLVVSLNRNFNF